MTRRIVDREKLKRATEASKRVLERARGAPEVRGAKAPGAKRPLRLPPAAGSTSPASRWRI